MDDARPQSPGEDAGIPRFAVKLYWQIRVSTSRQTEALAIEDKVFSSIGKQAISL